MWKTAGIDRAERVVVPFAFVLLAVAGLAASRQVALHFDEAYNLNLVATLAETGHYATRLGNVTRRFDPAITSGPIALAPLAPAFWLFGARLETVRLFQVVSAWLYVLVIFLSLRALSSWGVALAAVLLIATLPVAPQMGLSALGEFPTIALLFASTALVGLADRQDEARRRTALLLGSGTVMGCAVLAKDIALLYVGAAALVALARLVSHGRGPRQRAYLLVPLAALAPAIVWRVYQYLALSLAGPRLLAAWRQDLTDRSPTLWHDIAWGPFGGSTEIWTSAVETFWSRLVAFGLVLAVLGLMTIAGRARRESGRASDVRVQLIVVGAILWIGWFLLVSGPRAGDRHLVIGVALGQAAGVIMVARIGPALASMIGVPRAAARGLVFACLVLWTGGWVSQGVAWNLHFIEINGAKLASQRHVASWVRENVPSGQPLSGWGWYIPWEIAFLADRPVSAVDRGSPILAGLSDWMVVDAELAAIRSRDRRLDGLLSRQGDPAVADGGYAVYRITWRPERGG